MINQTKEFRTFSFLIPAFILVGVPLLATAQSPASDLESEFLLELLLDVDPQLDAGHTSIAPVTGGTFSGARLKGVVHDGGADWITQVSNITYYTLFYILS